MLTPKQSQKETEEKKERKFAGISLGDLIKAMITGCISIIIAYIVFTWQVEKPRITWTRVNNAAHRSGNKTVQIDNISMTNLGVKDAENIECIVKLPGNKLDSLMIEPDTVRLTKTVT